MAAAVDYSRAITASLFSSPQGSNAPPAESYIAHVQTFETVPGSPERKPRFLILSAARDGRLKLHKAKQNANGSFSIGKTWGLEELRVVEVSKRSIEGSIKLEPLEFILSINSKLYKYETDMPTSQQAAFLVTTVRCWRRYMTGRNQPDLTLVGFSVDNPARAPAPRPPASQPSSGSYTIPQPTTSSSAREIFPTQPPRPHSSSSSRSGPPRPSTSASNRTINSAYRDTPSPPPNVRRPSNPTAPTRVASPSSGRVVSPPPNTFSSLEPPRNGGQTGRRSPSGSEGRPSLDEVIKEEETPRILAPVARKPKVEEVVDDETVLSNVEEMLEGFDWRAGGAGSGGSGWGGAVVRTKGKADEIEKRLVGELKALEAASVHAIMESDDRVTFVIKHLDDALAELDKMDLMFGLYKTQLSLMSDDISHIEGQNRGLQVQTSNQRSLLAELDNLMNTIHIPDSDLTALSQESLENAKGVERLERAAVSLYKALLSTRDTPVGDMAAASERVEEYRTKASQFCKRIVDFLAIMFKFQVDSLINPKEPAKSKASSTLPSHATMEEFLSRYCGLMLFVKEIDYARYQQICAAYFTSMSGLHKTEITSLLASLRGQIKKATEEELDTNFGSSRDSPTIRQQSIRRAGTLVRSPLDLGRKDKDGSGKYTGSEAFGRALEQITQHVLREQDFISDFLHINALDASITFADYMLLETYFRRGATSYLASQQNKLKDIRSAMDLVFGFLDGELKEWIEGILAKDSMQIIGVLAAFDRAILRAEEERNDFLLRMLQKQYQKAIKGLEDACKDQIKSIEQTKLTLKKRKGVVPFVRIFPLFVSRVESQLKDADNLKIRAVVNTNYERIIATMFECLQQMAKMHGEEVTGEVKDQLNYHVIIIENMHHIITVVSKQNVSALAPFVAQAREKYNENLDLYIRLVLRRPFAKHLDYFQGLEQLLRTTPPSEVALHAAYTRAAVKRSLSDLRAKDLRKAIEVLYKRVDKHFGDISNPSAEHADVIKTVWKACEDEMQRLTLSWKVLVNKCYPEEKGGLEFGAKEVTEFFAKAQTS